MSKFAITDCGIRIPVNLMKFYGTDTLFSEERDYKNVDKHTRAGKYGRIITCPECRKMKTVYHFAWSATVCPNCKKTINKYDYLVFCKRKSSPKEPEKQTIKTKRAGKGED